MKTCGKGHEYTTLKCSVCKKARAKAYYEANKEKFAAYYETNKEKQAAYKKAYHEINPEKRAAYDKAYYDANKEKKATKSKAWREANPEKAAAYKKVWQKAHPEMCRATGAEYRAAKLQQTPPWYSHADCVAIYKELKPGYNIDHIIPLQGENVSGLHWSHNLQMLPAAENIAKSNKFDPATYVHQLPFY